MKWTAMAEIVVNYLKAAARDGHVEAIWRLGYAYDGDYDPGLEVDKKQAL